MSMNYKIAAKSVMGSSRKVNQDRYLILSGNMEDVPIAFCLVADGMGGLSEGNRASQTVIESARTWWHEELAQTKSDELNLSYISKQIKKLLTTTNQVIYDYGKRHNKLLGTTVSGVFIFGNEALCFHVGDSRVYLDGLQITDDHTWVMDQVDKGYLTAQEAATHPKRNALTRSLGVINACEITYKSLDLSDHNCLVICSDGIYNHIEGRQIFEVFDDCASVQQGLNSIFDKIKFFSHTDDATLLVIKINHTI